jgi:hypothetical protein
VTPRRRLDAGRLAIWIAFAALWVWLDVVVPLRHLDETTGDFRAYHQAARALAVGVSPYSESAFIYPPLLPVLMLPLASLPVETARVVWFCASQVALIGSFGLMLRVLGRGTAALAAVAAVWIAGGTVQENLVLGQVNPFLLLAIALALWLLPSRPRAAAAVIGVAAALKVWPAVLLLMFAWRRQWRPLLAGVAVTAALVVVPAAITAALVEQPGALGRDRPLRVGTAAPLNVSLPALALRIADPPRSGEMPASWIAGTSPRGFEPWSRHGWIAAAVAALVLIVAALALSSGASSSGSPTRAADRSLAGDRLPYGLEIGALVAAAILAAPVGWYHYELCQFPAFALAVERALAARRPRAALLALVLLALLTRAQAWGFGRYVARWGWTAQAPALLWLVTGVIPVVAAVWAAYLVREARRNHRLSSA